MLNEVLKNCEKWYLSADVKANQKKNNKRSGGSVLQIFITAQDTTSKLQIQYKRGMYFSPDFVCYYIHFDLSVKNMWGGFFCLTDKIS